MVSLHAFVDDSASEVGDRRLFLAAYVNGAGPWIAFGRDWRAELATRPVIPYLKMAEAQNLSGSFRGWSPMDRDAKILRLARLVETHRPWSVHCSVSRVDYARIVAPAAPHPLKQPYFCCFWGIIRTAADYHLQLDRNRPKNTLGVPPLNFVFDEQGGLGTDAGLWYGWLKRTQEPEVAALMGERPIFGDDKDMPALQASDMLAWHLRRRYERGSEASLPAFDLLVKDAAYREIDAATLEKWAQEFRRVPGIESVQTKSEWRRARIAVEAAVSAGEPPPDVSPLHLHRLAAKVRLAGRLQQRRRRAKPD